MRKNSVALYSTLSILVVSSIFAIKDALKDTNSVVKQDSKRFLVSSDVVNFHKEPLDKINFPKKDIITFKETPLGKIIEESQIEESINTPEVKLKLSLNSLKNRSEIANNFIKNKKGVPSLEDLNKLSDIYSLPHNLLYSQMLKESEGFIFAESHKNAKGLFQFLPDTARQFGLVVNNNVDERLDIWKSTDAAARYMSWIFTYLHPELDRTNIDNYNFVLASYNAGIGHVKKGNKLVIPNFKETKDYVRKIIGHSKGNLYLVKRGDKLANIAKDYDLTYKDLSILNNGIVQEKLIAGHYLNVDISTKTNQHIVNAGESLYKIANKYSTSVKDLKIANRLNTDIIGVGQKILIPL